MKFSLTLLFALAVALSASNAIAQLSYDESVDGDLSGAFGAPTLLVLGTGLNTITGDIGGSATGGATNASDADYFTFTLGANETVDSIVTSRTGSGTQSFVGYINGGAFGGQSAGDLDANTLFSDGESLLPGDLLAAPLTAGTHSFWFQETSGQVDYSVSLNVVTAVPEPSSAIALIGLGLAGLVRRRR